MPAAARITDLHTCPQASPTIPAIPHVGGPIAGTGSVSVLINGMPAAFVGSIATCIGPPDTLITGSNTVLIEGKPAVRVGDLTSHGGEVIQGSFNVLIGD